MDWKESHFFRRSCTCLYLPSCVGVPVVIASFLKPFKGQTSVGTEEHIEQKELRSSRTMLFLGLGAIMFVPVFKIITDLPPYIGMMLGLGVVWLVSEFIHPEEKFDITHKHQFSAHHALSRIELSSILFFLGILMAVAALNLGFCPVCTGA
jgi:Na+/H+ antiporter NhaD/arsenite permease-like protein